MSAAAGKVLPDPLLAKARRGERVTLLDKIASCESKAELDGLQAELARQGYRMSADELGACLRLRVSLRRLDT